MRVGPAAAFDNLRRRISRCLFVDVHEPHTSAFLRKSSRDGLANATRGARNNRRFALKPQAIELFPFVSQKQTPLFRKMKSSRRNRAGRQRRKHAAITPSLHKRGL